MKLEELSRLYHLACFNSHKLLDELYESVHSTEGDPLISPDEVKAVKQKYLAKIRHELELLQSAVDEING